MPNIRSAIAVAVIVADLAIPNAGFSFDLDRTDLAGIKLHQTDKEVVVYLKKKYGPSIKVETEMVNRQFGKGKRLESIMLDDEYGFGLVITFAEPVPPQKGNLVSAVLYMPTQKKVEFSSKTSTPIESSDALLQATISKYGAPDIIEELPLTVQRNYRARWCDKRWVDGFVPGTTRLSPNLLCKNWPELEFESSVFRPLGVLWLHNTDFWAAAENYLYEQCRQREPLAKCLSASARRDRAMTRSAVSKTIDLSGLRLP